MALGSTQPLTEMSTRCISWGWRRPVLKADNLPPFCAVVIKSGNLKFLELSGPLQACNGTALPFLSTLRYPLSCVFASEVWNNFFLFYSITGWLPKPPSSPLPSFDNPNYIICRVFVMEFLIIQFCPPFCLLRQQVLPPYHPVLLTSNSILYFHLRLALGCGLFWSVFHTRNMFAFLSPMHAEGPANLMLVDLIVLTT